MPKISRPGGESEQRKRRRRWTIPAAPRLLLHPFEASDVIEEVEGALGLALFVSLRSALLWNGTPPALRAELFYGDGSDNLLPVVRVAGTDLPSLGRAFATFERILTEPDNIDSKTAAAACADVSDWASEQGFAAAALEFAEAAAALRPRDSGFAFLAGRVARQQAAYERAEQWYDRSLGLARRIGDRSGMADALLGWGIMASQVGDHARAAALYTRAYRSARKGDNRRLGAAAQHNLLLLAVDTGELEAAGRHASLAARLYGVDDPRFPILAHDTAHLWATQDFFHPALPVYHAALPFIIKIPERVQAYANIAEAAGVLGDSETFFMAWDFVSRHSRAAGQFLAISVLSVAEGARALGHRQGASDLVQQAKKAARQRQQPDAEAAAIRIEASMRDGDPTRSPRAAPPDILSLADHFTRTLTS